MKGLIIGAVMIFIANTAVAQTTGSKRSTATENTVTKVTKKSATKKTQKRKAKVPLNQRKEYKGKNGQLATPTGQEATGINGGYSAMRKDTATKKPPVKQDQ